MSRRLVRTVAAAIAAVTALSVPAATANAAGELGLSVDGVTWSPGLSVDLFDSNVLWVPGDSRTGTFYARNQATTAGMMSVEIVGGPVQDLLASGDLRVTARTSSGGGASTTALPGTTRVLSDVVMPAGSDERVTIQIDFDPASDNPTQRQKFEFDVRVTLTEIAGNAPGNPPGHVSDSPPGNLPGTNTPWPITGARVGATLLAAALVLGFGTLLQRVTRRREEGADHA